MAACYNLRRSAKFLEDGGCILQRGPSKAQMRPQRAIRNEWGEECPRMNAICSKKW